MITEFKTLLELTRYFSTEQICKDYYAQIRWNGTPVCPHCGSINTYQFKDGILYKCAEKECNLKFTVRVGTIFENSKVSLQKWFMAIWFLTSHKKGISSYQLGKDIGVTQKTAWYMAHRVREMLGNRLPVKLEGTVEVDEVFVGGNVSNKHKWQRDKLLLEQRQNKISNKTAVVSIVERGTGKIYSEVVGHITGTVLQDIVRANVKQGSIVNSDEYKGYMALSADYTHQSVSHHQGIYAKGEIHTNTIEGFFSQLKRQIFGIHHFVTPKHLVRYCKEMGFRYERREQDKRKVL